MIELFFDGSCSPRNPSGYIGYGVFTLKDGATIYEHSGFVEAAPSNTNNIAEYMALICGLKWILENKIPDNLVIVRGDSMLVIKQMSRQWAVKKGAYVPYAQECMKLVLKIPGIKLKWIPREENERADALSTRELTKRGIPLFDKNKIFLK